MSTPSAAAARVASPSSVSAHVGCRPSARRRSPSDADRVPGLELIHDLRPSRRRQAPRAGARRARPRLDRLLRRRPGERRRRRRRAHRRRAAGRRVDPGACWRPESRSSPRTSRSSRATGRRCSRFAARQGRQLRFEAAVGGAMPIVRAIGDGLAGDRITRIVANPERDVATPCCRGWRRRAARCRRRRPRRARRGYAEADPSADLDGDDARAKLAILCALGFGLRVDPARIDARSVAAIGAARFRARAASGRRRSASSRSRPPTRADRR